MTSTISPTVAAGRPRPLPEDVEAARAAGRQLAQELPVPAASVNGHSVEAMVRAGLPRLPQYRIRAEIVRSRPNCVVLRSAGGTADEAERSCAFIAAWLESLPWLAHRVGGTVVESSCFTRGGKACIHTLLWQVPLAPAPAPAAPAAPAPPAPAGPAPPAPAPAVPQTAGERRRDVPLPVPELTSEEVVGWAGRASIAFRSVDGATPANGAGAAPAPTAAAGGSAAEATSTSSSPAVDDVPATEDSGRPEAAADRAAAEPLADEGAAEQPAPAESHASVTAARAAARRTEVVPVTAAPRGDGTGPAMPAREAATMKARTRRRPGNRRLAWVRRRALLLVIGMVAGMAGGYLASHHHVASYTSTAVLVVRSGASPTGPGSANDAGALAITDAALLPSDQAVISQVASTLHLPAASVSRAMVAQAVAGTALIQVHFTASSPTTAIAGANALASAVAGPRPNDQAIPNGSVAEVAKAKAASSSGSLFKYALPLGAILGLLLGAGAAMAAERADRRIDEPQSLNEASNCPVTVVPGGVSPTELARALERATGGVPVTLVPVRRAQLPAAQQLLRELRAAWPEAEDTEPGDRPAVAVAMPFAEAPDAVGSREGPTVLVVGAGERQRVVHEVEARLRLLDRAPVWSVLVVAS